LISAIALLLACTSLPYQDDTGFLVSAQANSPEMPVYVNGSGCKDVDGLPGLCSKRITSTEDLILTFDPQPFAYSLEVSCSDPITPTSATVPANQPFSLTIKAAEIATLKYFICVGGVFPQDRPQPISASWEVRVMVTDGNYKAREEILPIDHNGHHYLVLGQYARDSWVFDRGTWTQYSKKTEVEISDPSSAQAYTSSYNMRFNFFNWTGPARD
jgi:hypothetical protein